MTHSNLPKIAHPRAFAGRGPEVRLVSIFPERRTFKHHITGRTINRDLNIPGHLIPEYRLPYFPDEHADHLAQEGRVR